MELDSASSGYSSSSSYTLFGFKKEEYAKMQDANCSAPQSSNLNEVRYNTLRHNHQCQTDSKAAVDRTERQQQLNRKRKRTRQLNFESMRSTETGTEFTSSSETNGDGEEFDYGMTTDNVHTIMEDLSEFTDDYLIMADDEMAVTQIEDSAYRIDVQLYSPESLFDAELSSELSESEPGFQESDTDTEREEDAYMTDEFFEFDPESEPESEDSFAKLAQKWKESNKEIVRQRFPYVSMRIFASDFMTLMNDKFVNDTVVDFYLNHLLFNLAIGDIYRVHLLPSTFWYLMQIQLLEDADYKTDVLSKRLMRRYSNLTCFIENVDLFKQDFLILPINDLNHWSLCVVCCPEKLIDLINSTLVNNDFENNFNVVEPRPCIIMFDSQLSDKVTLKKHGVQIREFLQFAYMYQSGHSSDLAERFSADKIPVIVPCNLPQQTNQYDCALFIIEYVTQFMTNPPNMRKVVEGEFDFLAEYPSFSISGKRTLIKDEILTMSRDHEQFKRLLGYKSD